MLSAKEALEISNDQGKRKEKIKTQTERIESLILRTASSGERCIGMYISDGEEILTEVIDDLRQAGYEYSFIPQIGRITISW